MKRLAILGSTGSIGRQALEVVDEFPDRLEVTALAAGSNIELLIEQAKRYHPRYVVIGQPELQAELKKSLSGTGIRVLSGMEGLLEIAVASDVDMVLTAVVGSIGIRPTLAAIHAGKAVALANKETLVAAGSIIMPAAAANGVAIYPVDSEHSAIFQCLEGHSPNQVRRLLLTASGGPFRTFQPEELAHVTLEQALNHPNWSMGGKITIDSATMFNKGLEVIEAHWLFGMPFDRIDVVIHPESVIHSMVELNDGSTIAQLGRCDMRLPIQLALTYPERLSNSFPKLDLSAGVQLNFYPVDPQLFPAVGLAYEAGRKGGSLPAAFNAANEAAVEAFQRGLLNFTGIVRIVSEVMGYHQKESFSPSPDLNEILAVDAWARRTAGDLIGKGR
ncbi:1-deoxy-D-xylulose 5-phosphate reductoisomerase [Hydrogenispora ethanolica]|uniref:1-deoxy-D-xylulose 5-phosphate reductoisomerase n=1 Tax=Hydrogenispora ethanolica TaxID=1082276 RepID=A0A4R1RSF3_HYDET|nr:1-deoxy-D-xylulose-5-phosphate reductoisomerase [Hydrogenispora ethanolica]TCL69415.1 1-deoxy-D-xylulose 5-phosphate reductoisomerase [Hydrogenispora ethanolica]